MLLAIILLNLHSTNNFFPSFIKLNYNIPNSFYPKFQGFDFIFF